MAKNELMPVGGVAEVEGQEVLWFAHFSWITRIKKLIHLDTGQPASGSKVPVFHQYGYLYDIISLDTGQPASGSKVSFFCQYGAILGHRTLKLISGSCYLPHPDKEETGGEDAHFICIDEQAIGVADGVGGWADVGVDAGEYARELMSNSVTAIQEEPKGSIDPSRVLEKAHSSTKAKGSSTACIVALTDQGLQAINLGDSGFIVVRDGCTIFQSPVQQHGFNFTYQLESGRAGDLPSSGQVS
ncbi:putative protein phosphatase 2C 55 [Vitis vinifera]|uniref:Protein phosphatase n=1 Tax=Vitis vinifera TaxID=29760 RepID=A0A438GIF2_VITVI|nr:putative protein phosphatase 2C 55 [Vitis vinifera]